jgi:hypothetical protein
MYFEKFTTFLYPFKINGKTEYKQVKDITQNVRVRKEILANVTLYDEYDIRDAETPEHIAERVYGNAKYHWVVMLCNERYDYVNDFPLSQFELDAHIANTYGATAASSPHHYLDSNGFITDTSLKSINLLTNGYGYITTPTVKVERNIIDKDVIGEYVEAQASVTISDQIPFAGTITGNILTVTYVTQAMRKGQLIYDKTTLGAATTTNLGIPAGTKIIQTNADDNTLTGTGSIGTYRLNNSVTGTVATSIGQVGISSAPVVSLYSTDGLVLSLKVINYGKGYFNIPTVSIGYPNDPLNGILTSPASITPATIGSSISVFEVVTNSDHEVEINESKRRIKLISPALLNQILKNFNDLI